MAYREMIFALAKVAIAAAWADGEITPEEINSMKDLLFELPLVGFDAGMQLSGREMDMLQMYVETPVGPAERERLVVELQNELRTQEDKDLAISALEQMVAVDGHVSDSEREVMAQIEEAINTVQTGGFSQLQRLIGGAVDRRTEAVASAPNREDFFEDYINNRVFYSMRQRLQLDGESIDDLGLPEVELRRLSVAGGLMAQIAEVDREVTDAEFESMVEAMRRYWELDEQAAAFVAEVAVSAVGENFDAYRMVREFHDLTTPEERRRFLNVLFAVAAADGMVSFDETEEIRILTRGMNLLHEDFINAKLSVPREQRAE